MESAMGCEPYIDFSHFHESDGHIYCGADLHRHDLEYDGSDGATKS